MAKIKLTKNELKTQRDALKMYERYLPTLQLKKQQLQSEVRGLREQLVALKKKLATVRERFQSLAVLMDSNEGVDLQKLLKIKEWHVGEKNVAGTDVPVFDSLIFEDIPYDLFRMPYWYDDALEILKSQLETHLRYKILTEQCALIEQELRVVTQRVNLFDKVKIPEARDSIRRINIYIGDQQTNSVGRSKIAKAKCKVRDAALSAG